jgi:hypothetical protein
VTYTLVDDLKQTRIQVARAWPESDAGWTTLQGAWAEEANEGSGQNCGSMSFSQRFGVVKQPLDTDVYQWGIHPDYRGTDETTELTGQYVRLLVEDSAGTVVIGTQRFTARWWGIVGGRTVEPDGATDYPGGVATWECFDIVTVLNQMMIHGGAEIAADGSTVLDPGFCPVFNDLPFGDSTDITHEINDAIVYVFNRGEAGGKTRWRARDILELILARYAQFYDGNTFAGGLRWELGNNAALAEFDAGRVVAQGRPVLELLNELINPRRGLTWKRRVVGSYVYIDLYSTSEVDVSVGAATVPAATQVNVEIGDDPLKSQVRITQDPVAADHIRMVGGWCLAAMTLQFQAGQTGENFAIIPGENWDITDVPSLDPTAVSTWRTFRINPAWNAKNYNSAEGLRHALSADGSRAYQATGNPQAAVLRLDRLTPLGADFATEAYGPRNEPVILIGSGTSWIDYSSQLSLTVTQDPAGIIIGIDYKDALRLKALLEDGTRSMLITIGVYEWAPLQTWWTRSPDAWPRDLPRPFTKTKSELVQRLVIAGTVSGALTGVLQTQPSTVIFRDDLPVLQAEQALAQARLSGSGGANATWTQQGELDFDDTYAPGAFIGNIISGDRAFRVMGSVTRRSWNFRLGGGTTYTTERIPVDIEARP